MNRLGADVIGAYRNGFVEEYSRHRLSRPVNLTPVSGVGFTCVTWPVKDGKGGGDGVATPPGSQLTPIGGRSSNGNGRSCRQSPVT